MKKIITILILACLYAANAQAARIYWRSSLTGGGTGALDAISVTDASPGVPLSSGDAAVVLGSQTYYYTYDALNASAETSPAIIAPDNAGATGRWLRVPSFMLATDVQGLATVATSGNYADLTGTPTIPTAVSQLTNDSGFISSYNVTEGDVTAHQAALSLTESQISDLAHTVDTDTHLSETEVDAYVANNGYSTGSHTVDTDTHLSDGEIGAMGYIKSYTETDPTAEPALGNPASDGYILSSTAAGTRSWVPDGGSVDLTDPGPIGSVTPSTGKFTTLEAESFSLGQPVSGQTGEMSLPEDPDNGTNVVGFKAPGSVDADVLWELPATDGTNGQVWTTDGAAKLSWSTPGGGGDMLQSTYDANTDNLIDDTAIAASIARDSELPTLTSQLTNDSGFSTGAHTVDTDTHLTDGDISVMGYIKSYTETDPTAEPALGNPASDGYVLSSTATGSRSWVAQSGGSVDLTDPGPIGSVTPDTGTFTDLVANTFDWGTPANGTTGEIALREDPVNGTNLITFKAPADIATDVVWTFPAADGADGQVWSTDAAGAISWSDAVLDTDIGTTVQAYDADLADLADGSLSGSKVGTGISGSNITTGTVPEAQIDAAIARDSEVTLAPVAAPASATDTCTAGAWSYDASYMYVCTATDTWLRAAIATW